MTDDIIVFGEAEPGAMKQAETCAKTADYVALMADNHRGYAVPIGGVVAYRDSVSPSGVGYDIGCGNKAVRLDTPAPEARARISDIMDEVYETISFGVGRKNPEPVDSPVLDSPDWVELPPNLRKLKDMAASQLGTVGSGNHYVDIFIDELDRVWIGVHFGSRGFGYKVATHYLKQGGAKRGMDAEPCIIDASSDLGESYIKAMQLAGRYAYAGRDWVCERVAEIIGGQILEEVHNHHNFAWKENHFGEDLWVVRKGATPARPGQKGFVGASMAEPAVILEGVESPRSAEGLYSTIHGAGRVMGRREAKGKFRRSGRVIRAPRVTRDDMEKWTQEIELRGADVDEAPQCYKRLPDVLDAHAGTIRVLHTLTPIGVAMAGRDEYDPYKD